MTVYVFSTIVKYKQIDCGNKSFCHWTDSVYPWEESKKKPTI